MYDNSHHATFPTWFCEHFTAITCLTPGSRAYVLELTLDANRASSSEVLKETMMYGATRCINDSVSGLKI